MKFGWLVNATVPLLLIAPWASGLIGPARAEGANPGGPRVALLVGNYQYEGGSLPGVGKSLARVEQALERHGFQVTKRENLGEKEFKEEVERFARTIPTNGAAVFYYAGFAAHVERFGKYENLLRPVDAAISNDNDYRARGLNLGQLLTQFRDLGGGRVNLVLLDGSWDSPIRPSSDKVFGGLREFEADPQTVVLFGAASGEVRSLPQRDEASPLAESLAAHLEKWNESVDAGCRAIAAAAGGVWFSGGGEGGIGEPSRLPVTLELREGKSPGEGFVNSLGMGFRWCPPGRFTMGSAAVDPEAVNDRAPVEVTLTRGFWMGEHEVTQREYYAVAKRTPGPGFTLHNNAPYWGVSEAKFVSDFCNKLNEVERAAGRLPAGWEYACPTEAEWEYACRAGSTARYCFGDSVAELGKYGNFADRALWLSNPDYHWAEQRSDDGVAEALAPVGSYLPNAWGLRDMHGNVAEMVADHLLPELPGGVDPLGRAEKEGRPVIRGGAWCSAAEYCESSFRNSPPGRDKFNFIGFRVAIRKVQ